MTKILEAIKRIRDRQKMLEIIKNCLTHHNTTYTESKLKGLCRVSFAQTYGYSFTEIETLWPKAKT